MTWDQLFDAPGPAKDYNDTALGPILRSDAALLGAIMNYVRPEVVVEYGSLDGHSASVLARFAKVVYCVEADNIRPGLHHTVEANPNVVIVNASMRDWLPPPGTVVDVGYFDASHDLEDNISAYAKLNQYLSPHALLLCHDTDTWVKHPSQGHIDFQPTRDKAVDGERKWVEWMRDRGWDRVAFGCKTAFRHGLTILQRETGW